MQIKFSSFLAHIAVTSQCLSHAVAYAPVIALHSNTLLMKSIRVNRVWCRGIGSRTTLPVPYLSANPLSGLFSRRITCGKESRASAQSQLADYVVERNEQRKQQNLEIAERVAKGELRPVVVSFAPRIREELRLAKRFKHSRIFVEENVFESISRLRQTLTELLENPLAKLPSHAYTISVVVDSDESSGVDGDEADSLSTDKQKLEKIIHSDEDLRTAYLATQSSRASGIGKLRLQIRETDRFDEFVAERRGYTKEAQTSVAFDSAASWHPISFYRLAPLADPLGLTERMRTSWEALGVRGRVYVAAEGVNAQVAVPDVSLPLFRQSVKAMTELDGVYLNPDFPVDIDTLPFSKLQIKLRKQILADGLDSTSHLDWNNNGGKLTPEQWHQALAPLDRAAGDAPDPSAPVLLDVRNIYESQVGLFKGAQPLDTVTFRETWDAFKAKLAGVDPSRQILTYCTGGIRCEKANAYLIQEMGYKNVASLKGGIINYVQYVESNKLRSRFVGVNHVFDQRLGQRVDGELLATCISCGSPCDVQTDCANTHCPRPYTKRRFVQCADCAATLDGCCGGACRDETAVRGRKDALVLQDLRLRADLKRARDRARSTGKREVGEAEVREIEAQLAEIRQDVEAAEARLPVLHARAVAAVAAVADAADAADADTEALPAAGPGSPGRGSGPAGDVSVLRADNHLGGDMDAASAYAAALSSAEHPCLAKVREWTEASMKGREHMLSGVVQARLLSMLVALARPRKVLEIGTFTGYSGLAMASALPPGATLLSLEKDPAVAQVARGHVAASPWAERMEVRECDAVAELQNMAQAGEGPFEVVFLDANKRQYVRYLEGLLETGLLPVGGLLVVDNVLWKGRVPALLTQDEQARREKATQLQRKGAMSLLEADKYAEGMHAFNTRLRGDARLEVALLPVRDGLSLIRRVA